MIVRFKWKTSTVPRDLKELLPANEHLSKLLGAGEAASGRIQVITHLADDYHAIALIAKFRQMVNHIVAAVFDPRQ